MLELLGFKLTHLIAGVAGGITRYVVLGGGDLKTFITSVVAGGFTAAYGTTPAYLVLIHQFPNLRDPSTEYLTCYCVGLCALIFCEGIMTYAKKRRDNYLPASIPAAAGPGVPIPPPPPAPKLGE